MMRRTALRRSTKPTKRTPMLRGTTRVGEAARRRVREGGPVAKGRVSLSLAGLAELRNMVLARSGGRCEACGERRFLQLEHALPRGRGGADTWGNCWATCPGCHRRKEAPYATGRLLVTPRGDGVFAFELVTGTKDAYVGLGAWTGGRVATPEEAARLAELR